MYSVALKIQSHLEFDRQFAICFFQIHDKARIHTQYSCCEKVKNIVQIPPDDQH